MAAGVTVGGVRLREVASGIASWLAGFAPIVPIPSGPTGPADEPVWALAFRGGEHAP